MEPSVLERSQHPVSRRDIDPNVLKVLYRLINSNFTAYLVGGGVRDLMMRRQPKDFDVATSAHPNQVRELFRNSRLIGRRFRLVHVFFGPQNIEVATFRRRSEETDSADPMITHDNTFGTAEEDAFRRDFTINSLFYDPRTFCVIDYTNGVPDLRAHLIRTVGEPEVRMREDPVRMIRAVRFAAKLGFKIEHDTRAAIERHCGDLAKASVPRRVEEIYRTLGLEGSARALVLMEQLGLLDVMLPELSSHLRTHSAELETSNTVRNLAAMEKAIAAGLEPTHSFVLAVLFADLYLATMRGGQGAHRLALSDDLRSRGFSRADTDEMRHLLEALGLMIAPSRLTRRLKRRPYFDKSRMLFAMLAPTYGADLEALDRFFNEPARERHPAHRAHARTGEPVPTGRRRRRRGGRRRRRSRAQQHPAANANAAPITQAPGNGEQSVHNGGHDFAEATTSLDALGSYHQPIGSGEDDSGKIR